MAFIKIKDLVSKPFVLKDLTSRKHFAIWNDFDKKVMKVGDEITLSTGKTIVAENLQIPKEDSAKYRYMINYNRNIFVNNEEFTVGFGKNTDSQIIALANSFKELGLNLENIAFILEKQDNQMNPYKVSAKKNETTQITNIKLPNITQSDIKSFENKTELSEKEKNIVEIYKKALNESGYNKNDATVKQGYILGIMDNGISKERAEIIYNLL